MSNIQEFPFLLSPAGYISHGGGEVVNIDEYGSYEGATSYNETMTYRMSYNLTSFTPYSAGWKMDGRSARYTSLQTSWRLPTGGSGGEFEALYTKYNSSSELRKTTGPNYVLSGNRYGNETTVQGEYGRYWSKTSLNNNDVNDLTLDSAKIYNPNEHLTWKNLGFTVRYWP